jgi:hypothetical protein
MKAAKVLMFLVLILCASRAFGQAGGFNAPATGGGTHGTGAPTGSCTAGTFYTNDSNGNAYSCNAGSWQIITTSGGGVTASAGQSLYASATNSASGGTIVLDMAGISGADLGAKMNACATALPAVGGTCKGDNLTGALTLSTAVTTAKPVIYTFSGQAISQSANVTLGNSGSGIDACNGTPAIFTKAGNIDQFTITANATFIRCLTLVGVSGSFTGNGIVQSGGSGALIERNTVSGEAATAIKNTAGSGWIQFNNVVSSASGVPAVSSASDFVEFNTVSTSLGDGIDITGNQMNIIGNSSALNIAGAVSGICAIAAKGDMIGDRFIANQTQISDTNGADLNYGICDNPSGTHNLNMLFAENNHFGVVSGGAQAYGFFLNNSNNLNTNWSVIVRNEGCVHLTFCIKRTDTQNNNTEYVDIQPGDTTLDAGTGSTADTWVFDTPQLPFASLPTPVGDGSHGFCSNCTTGRVITGTGTHNYVYRVNGIWVGQPVATWQPIQSNAATSNTATTAVTLTTHVQPGDFLAISVYCDTAGGAPTFTVTDSANTITSAIAQQATPAGNGYVQIFYAVAVVGGAETVTDTSSVNVCTANHGVTVAEYSGIAPTSPVDGAGASANGNGTALASGSYTCTNGDLVFGIGGALATGLSVPGGGFTTRGNPNNGTLTEDQTCSGGTANVTMSAATGNWAAAGVAFKRAP